MNAFIEVHPLTPGPSSGKRPLLVNIARIIFVALGPNDHAALDLVGTDDEAPLTVAESYQKVLDLIKRAGVEVAM